MVLRAHQPVLSLRRNTGLSSKPVRHVSERLYPPSVQPVFWLHAFALSTDCRAVQAIGCPVDRGWLEPPPNRCSRATCVLRSVRLGAFLDSVAPHEQPEAAD